MKKNENKIDPIDMMCLTIFLDQDLRVPVLYGLDKLRKGHINLLTHTPVVATVGSSLQYIGRWVDPRLN